MTKKKAQKAKSKTTVRRIKATDSDSVESTKIKTVTKTDATTKTNSQPKKPLKKISEIISEEKKKDKKRRTCYNPFTAFIGYVKASWGELKQVHWPSRSATWALTFAVLIFTAFFVVLIILLDYGFETLFKQIIK